MSQTLGDATSATLVLSARAVQIANEIAMDVLPTDDIKKLYGFSDVQWAALMSDPGFDAMLRGAIETWNGAKNVEQRVRFKAAASVEMSLLRFHTDMNNPDITLAARTEALKTIMKLANMGAPEQAQGAGTGGWSLQINIGGHSIGVQPAGPNTPTIEGQLA